ncbi:RsmB/NOP family class I SAM-dependent RNA methyltransferase [Parvularcula maris]|uniref:RsmB/NOP family class I SAM-dependent RNA methyltransferase n=1 Tax=Parvularcula maris TaxID=2965077 RepID=A0A9X2RIN4_9PROT|nr:RsmB/NOP family class I SAM-dependent RNA methyltransferase [Parvularcula maris]MCQ8186209.1 RsmB/NOP family class I SAM-dependent RNA methyltransferase [Parvularcula maris]
MRDPGRIAAAIDVLDRYALRPQPLSLLIQDWGRRARYAGSKDRAFVRGLCLDVLRRWRSSGAAEDRRRGMLVTLRDHWGWPMERIEEAFSGEHGPGALTDEERTAGPTGLLDLPSFLEGLDGAAEVSEALASRAPVDLRVNLLKGDRDKALKATVTLGAEPAPLSPTGLRIPPAGAAEKGPGVTVIPAYGKGLVEVQDEGSQLTVLAVGDLRGKQVLDYCAGGGGKTLALAAEMGNTGQLFAYDSDPQRLAPIHDRVRRAGVRNVQVLPPQEPEKLEALERSMDLVFVDAPCSGSGTWRRHPDAKWRLTEEHLQRRQEEQDQVLREAYRYVKPGGVMVFVTCSFLASENEERVAAFLRQNSEFSLEEPLAEAAGELRGKLAPFVTGSALRLTPWTSETDGFTLMRLRRITQR